MAGPPKANRPYSGMLRGSKSVTGRHKPFIQYEDGSLGRVPYPAAPAGQRAMRSKGIPMPKLRKPVQPKSKANRTYYPT